MTITPLFHSGNLFVRQMRAAQLAAFRASWFATQMETRLMAYDQDWAF